jgi:hypothetical protein
MVSGIGSPTIQPYEQPLARTNTPASNGQNAADTTLVAANAHREASGELSIVTQEGDTVTLSAHLEADATYASFRSRGAQASYLSIESSSSIEISVQGDLSEQEMKDIEKLVKQFSHELRQYFRGSEGADANDVGQGSFSSIAGIAVHLEAEASVTAVSVHATGGRPSGLGWSPTPAPISPAPSPGDSPANPAGEVSEGAGDVTSTASAPIAIDPSQEQQLAQLMTRLSKLMERSGANPEKAAKALNRMLDRLSEALDGKKEHRHTLDHVRRQVNSGSGFAGKPDGDTVLGPAQPAPVGD